MDKKIYYIRFLENKKSFVYDKTLDYTDENFVVCTKLVKEWMKNNKDNTAIIREGLYDRIMDGLPKI